ncbi:hypothetical protein XH89_17075 [Bradyrhizobium sp. CCBAU 53340]|nr:hypothetical protein XH89_17075 [Bradyrhizobium sp. CCBAU 53340]
MTTFVGIGWVSEWEGWEGGVFPPVLACGKISAIALVAGSAATGVVQFIAWLLHQVMTEPNLRLAMETSRLDQLNTMRERIKLARLRPRP